MGPGHWLETGDWWKALPHGRPAADKDPSEERPRRCGERRLLGSACCSVGKSLIFRLKEKRKKIQSEIQTTWGRFSLIISEDPFCEKPHVGYTLGTGSGPSLGSF